MLAGYLAHFAARAFLLMGEFGYVWPVVAGWFVPLTLFGAAGGVLWLIQNAARPEEDRRLILDDMLVNSLAAGLVDAENIE